MRWNLRFDLCSILDKTFQAVKISELHTYLNKSFLCYFFLLFPNWKIKKWPWVPLKISIFRVCFLMTYQTKWKLGTYLIQFCMDKFIPKCSNDWHDLMNFDANQFRNSRVIFSTTSVYISFQNQHFLLNELDFMATNFWVSTSSASSLFFKTVTY